MQFINRTGVNTALPNSFYQAHQDQIHAYAATFELGSTLNCRLFTAKARMISRASANFLESFDKYFQDSDYLSRVKENRVKLNM